MATAALNELSIRRAEARPRPGEASDNAVKLRGEWKRGDRKMQFVRKLIKSSKGATAIEYGLIAALIAVAAIAAMQGIGTSLKTTFNNVSSAMN
jgi:pilus assembly protein Flp/PilA